MVALTIGFDSSSMRPLAVARAAARGTRHCSSRGNWYPSTTGLGRASSRHLDVADAFWALLDTCHIYSRIKFIRLHVAIFMDIYLRNLLCTKDLSVQAVHVLMTSLNCKITMYGDLPLHIFSLLNLD